MPQAAIAWSEDRVALLKKLHAERYSAAQIAAELGHVSRNSVLGKIHRLGLSCQKPLKTKPREYQSRVRHSHGQQLPAELLEPFSCIEIVPRNLQLLELRSDDCRYPVNDVPPFLFCGHPKMHGSSYCAGHHDLTHTVSRHLTEADRQRRREHFIRLSKKSNASRIAA
jgi:GcrA cell cycle regulator